MSVQRWSEEVDLPITEALVDSVTIDPAKVRLRVGEFEEERDVPRDAKAVIFRVPLDAGITRVEANFIDAEGESYAAYYVYVKRLTT